MSRALCLALLLLAAAPLRAAEPSLSLTPLAQLVYRDSDPERQLSPFFRGIRGDDEVDPPWRVEAELRALALLAPGIDARFDFRISSFALNDPRNRTVDFDQLDASNIIDQAYVRWSGEVGELSLGRRWLSWGPHPERSLSLSAYAPSPELLQGALDFGPHRFSAFSGQLSSETLPNDHPTDPGAVVQRWLYGHRAELNFERPQLSVGVSELALVAGVGQGFSLRYANPVQLYMLAQSEEHGDDSRGVNVLFALDATWSYGDRFELFGSWIVDDLQVDKEGSEKTPDQLAWNAGGDARVGPLRAGYEYRRVGSWTYIHPGEGTSFSQFGTPLAAPEGPDTDRHRVGVQWPDDEDAPLSLSMGLSRVRRGENRLWTEEDRQGHAGESYLRGVVERRWISDFRVEWSPRSQLTLRLDAQHQSIENAQNEDGDEDIWVFAAALQVLGPSLSWVP